MFARVNDVDTPVEVMRLEGPRHSARIAAIARERDSAASALDRTAQRQITARRLAIREESLSHR